MLNAGKFADPGVQKRTTVKDNSTGKRIAASILTMNAIREARVTSLKSTHKAVLYAIATRLNWKRLDTQGRPYAWPSYERLAGDAGMARSTCVNAVKSLIRTGYLLKGTRKTDRGKSNIYVINVGKLESAARIYMGPGTPEEPTDPIPSTTRSKVSTAPSNGSTAPCSDVTFREYRERFARRTA